MKAALYDPEDGYYCRIDQNRWGREGDYRTSPERSSLFAATFARFFAGLYEDLGRPAKWTILEAGAGDGRFASGVLQTLQQCFPDVFSATYYVIEEVSSLSRSLAGERLKPYANQVEVEKLAEAKMDCGVVFSNELFDAFPVHRVTVHDGQLQEFYVNVGGNENFEWLLGAPRPASSPRFLGYFEDCGIELGEGQVAEVSLEMDEWFSRVAGKMRAGYVVTVDYGATAGDLHSPARAPAGTLRGFRRHQFVDDLLASPGDQDLTTTVNWSFVKSIGARLGFEAIEFGRQDMFLLAHGLPEQLALELQQCEGEAERLRISTAAREMILPDGMASHFQVLVQKKTS
jgi:SAM-dependent MidA family methyltransferase